MKIYSWYFWSWSLLNHISIQNRLSLKRGTRNGERGMRLTIFHEILHSEQFIDEFIDDDSFVWFLTPANGGRCHLSGHSFGRRAANASILMKFCTLNKCRAVNSMVTNFFYKFWCLSILKSVNVGTCHLLGHGFGSFEWRTANVSILMKLCTQHKLRVVNSIVTIIFCDFRRLSSLTPVVKIWQIWQLAPGDPFFHSFGPKMANLPILIIFCTLHKLSAMNSIVAIVFWDSWRLPILATVHIGTCYLLGYGFQLKTANASVLIKVCTLHKTRVVNSMVSILRDASGCHRKIKLRIEKQILCQKYYCYIISKTGKKLWPTSAKLHS